MTKTYSNRSNCIRAARKLLGKAAQIDVDFKITGVDGALDFETIVKDAVVIEPTPAEVQATAAAEICAAADKSGDLDIPTFLQRKVPTGEEGVAYRARLAQIAKLGAPDRELVLRKSDVTKAAKASAAPKETKIGAVLAKAQASGVTTAEIHSMTGWKKIGGFFTAVKRHGLTLTKTRENKITTFFAAKQAVAA